MRWCWLVLIGFVLGVWFNSDGGAQLGYRAGVWTRDMLGFPPIAVQVYPDRWSVGPSLPRDELVQMNGG